MKTINGIIKEVRREFAGALADQRLCAELDAKELDHCSELLTMSYELGFSDLPSAIAYTRHAKTVAEVAAVWSSVIAILRAETAELGRWNNVEEFLLEVLVQDRLERIANSRN
jgi:hypothetical protein